jgi:hypothetical protein
MGWWRARRYKAVFLAKDVRKESNGLTGATLKDRCGAMIGEGKTKRKEGRILVIITRSHSCRNIKEMENVRLQTPIFQPRHI